MSVKRSLASLNYQLTSFRLISFVALIEEHPQPELARGGQVEPPIAIQINHAVLPAERNAFAWRGDGVPGEFRGGTIPTVVVNGGRIGGSGIASVMGPDAFARDQFLLAVTVQIGQRDGVGLRPGFINHMPLPHGRPVRLRRLLLPPIQTDVVTASKDDIEASVPVEIFDYERATRMRQRSFAVKFPRPGERVARRPLVPADFTEHIFTPVAGDVAERVPVPAALRAEDEGL